MNKGIEILIARMESSPDEFLGVNNKWVNLMESHEDYMTDEDRKALFGKLNELRMNRFTEHVMKKLLEDQQEKSEAFGNYAQAIGASMQQTKNQLAQAMLQNQYANNTAAMNQAGAVGIGTGQMYIANGAGSIQPLAQSNQLSTSIQLGKQTLTEKTLKKIKALIK